MMPPSAYKQSNIVGISSAVRYTETAGIFTGRLVDWHRNGYLFSMEIRVIGLLVALGATLLTAACGNSGTEKRPVSAEKINIADSAAPMILSPDTVLAAGRQTLELIRPSDQIPGIIDSTALDSLSEPLRAMAARYAAMGGTDCDGEYCALTSALKLGKQGSEAHKSLIAKYFPNDSIARQVLAQDCYLRPSGASSFSEYASLSLSLHQDTVTVDYRLLLYNRGKTTWKNGADRYVFKDGTFSSSSRN